MVGRYAKLLIFACAFIWLVKAKTTILKAIIALSQAFLAFHPLVHEAESSSDHISESYACSTPRKALQFLLDIPFVHSLSRSFSSFHLAALEWSGLPGTLSVVPCPET